ncbi:hypothetical protein EZBTHKR_0259 [Elizabethkingia anophelis]|nr:hypothetical protein EZBTHKR_0259 [Elizabethkingia anophelis]
MQQYQLKYFQLCADYPVYNCIEINQIVIVYIPAKYEYTNGTL